MAIGVERTQIQLKNTTVKVTIPSDPIAKLMYYLNCFCYCVEVEKGSQIDRLGDYGHYWRLTDEEKTVLLTLCLTLSPDKLIGTIFFPTDKISFGNGIDNEFFKVSTISSKMVVSESFLIGGQQQRVCNIMMFKKTWMETNYIEPLRSIQRSLSPPPQRSSSSGSSCTIL